MVVDHTTIDETKLEAFLGKAVTDMGAAASAALVVIGDRLGLYRAMDGAGPLTSADLAERTGTSERYINDWLVNQAAGGYLAYDAASDRFSLPPEQALALAREDSPAFLAGGYELIMAIARAEAQIGDAMRLGIGMCWGEHDPALFRGTERFFRTSYVANLVQSWLPALAGVVPKLEAGALVADVGCGHAAATVIMAQAFPRSRFVGFDSHAPSIDRARQAARAAGVDDRVSFELFSSVDYPARNYDLICFFDCFHDMGQPADAARHALESLHPNGTVLIVEPMAGETIAENLNPVGRIHSAASVLCCVPNALCQGGPALGTIATDRALGDAVLAGGFTRFRRATASPFNRVFEARP